MFDLREYVEQINEYNRKVILTYYNESHKIWKDIEEFLFDYHPKIIEKFENIENLSKKLYKNENKKEETHTRPNKYLTFFIYHSKIIELKRIFPDKNEKFKLITKLLSATNNPEIIIDNENG